MGSLFSKWINFGVTEHQTIEEASRLRIINKFSLLCISYSIPYILFSVSFKFYEPAFVFFIGQLFYIGSLWCNNKHHYNTAKFLIVFATNFSVFYLSLFYGFDSGFHLYYFTSPLIVFSLYNFSEISKIAVGNTLYMTSLIILVAVNHQGLVVGHKLPGKISDYLYFINIFLALSFCLLIVAHFSSFYKRINQLLYSKNIELEKKQNLLEDEIEERKSTGSKLQTSLKDKETLLSETHHRVKNNLAVVSGMLDLQVLLTDNENVKSILSDSRSRIKSMSLIHESLYKYDSVSQIEFGRYINDLASEIKKSYHLSPCEVSLLFELDKIYLPVTLAIPSGLLINEVLTNAYKHAFTNKKEGKIKIIFKQNANICTLIIADDGVGIGEVSSRSSSSIGLTLIEAFVKQLKGNYKLENNKGTRMTLEFELK